MQKISPHPEIDGASRIAANGSSGFVLNDVGRCVVARRIPAVMEAWVDISIPRHDIYLTASISIAPAMQQIIEARP